MSEHRDTADPAATSAEVPPPAHRSYVRRAVGTVLLVAAAGVLLALFILGIEVLFAAFGGVLLAVFLRACTDVVKRYTRMSDGWALTTALLVILLIITATGWLLAPQVSAQLEELSERLPQILSEAEDFLRERAWGVWVLEQIQDQGENAEGQIGNQVSGFVSGLSRWSSYVLTSLFVGLFGAANPSLYTRGIVHLTPLRHRERVRELISEIAHTLRWWLIGQALAMLVIGISTTIVLMVFGIPMAIVLGIIVGILGFIPYLGPLLGAVPVAMIAAMEGLKTFLYVMGAYTVVQVLEGYIATPLIQRKTVYLPPVFTIISQILLGMVIGMLGFIYATPLAAVVLVMSRFYRMDILEDDTAKK